MTSFIGNYEKYVSDMFCQIHQQEEKDTAISCKALERLKK